MDDCSLPWAFAPDSIDFVHIRYLAGSIQDWPALFREAYRCTKPGGWIQSFDTNGGFVSDNDSVKENSALSQWGKLFAEGGKILGWSFSLFEKEIQRRCLEDAGFIDIEEKNFKVPLGRWPKDPKLKEVGTCTAVAIDQDVEGYVLYVANMLGWSKEEVMVYAAHIRRELRNPAIHGYYKVKVVWGRKPEA